MATKLNGSSQYVALGNGVSVLSARPITIAALVDTTGLRTTSGWNAIYSQGDWGDRGWGFEIEAATNPRLYFTWRTGVGQQDTYSSFNIPANSGVWLVMAVLRDAGANSAVDFYGYRYDTRVLSTGTAGGGGTNDNDPTAVGGSDPALIGAFYDGGVIDYYPSTMGWVAIWNADLGDVGSASPKRVWELIRSGPWAVIDAPAKLFMPLTDRWGVRDLSGNGFNGTLTGSPAFVLPLSPTEEMPVTVAQRRQLWRWAAQTVGGSPVTVTVNLTGAEAGGLLTTLIAQALAGVVGGEGGQITGQAQGTVPAGLVGADGGQIMSQTQAQSPTGIVGAEGSGSLATLIVQALSGLIGAEGGQTNTGLVIGPVVIAVQGLGAEAGSLGAMVAAVVQAVLTGAEGGQVQGQPLVVAPTKITGAEAGGQGHTLNVAVSPRDEGAWAGTLTADVIILGNVVVDVQGFGADAGSLGAMVVAAVQAALTDAEGNGLAGSLTVSPTEKVLGGEGGGLSATPQASAQSASVGAEAGQAQEIPAISVGTRDEGALAGQLSVGVSVTPTTRTPGAEAGSQNVTLTTAVQELLTGAEAGWAVVQPLIFVVPLEVGAEGGVTTVTLILTGAVRGSATMSVSLAHNANLSASELYPATVSLQTIGSAVMGVSLSAATLAQALAGSASVEVE